MAAFGILAALRERDRTGEGQFVDVSMADGALSWLAMVAARVLRRRRGARGAATRCSPARCVCYRPYRCADGWVTLGALEPKFFAAWCRGVGREDLIEHQFEPPGIGGARRGRGDLRGAHARRVGGVRRRARLLPGAGARASTRRWTPSSCARARWWSSSSSPAPEAGRGCSACRSSSAARPGDARPRPGPGARRAHRARCCARRGYGDEEIAALLAGRRGRRRRRRGRAASFLAR